MLVRDGDSLPKYSSEEDSEILIGGQRRVLRKSNHICSEIEFDVFMFPFSMECELSDTGL